MRGTSVLAMHTLKFVLILSLFAGSTATGISADQDILSQFEAQLQERFDVLAPSVVDIVVDVVGDEISPPSGRPQSPLPRHTFGERPHPEPPVVFDATGLRMANCNQGSSLQFLGPDRMGTGVVIDERKHILTSESLIRGLDQGPAYTIKIQTESVSPEVVVRAEIVGSDPFTGIVILRPLPQSPAQEAMIRDLQPVELAGDFEARAGSIVIMLSNAYGMKHSSFWGLLSGRQQHLDCWLMHDYLQTTLPLHPGAVGAPVCDRRGRVIGIMAASFRKSPWQEVSFAIPTNRFLDAIPVLIEQGCVPRGYLGVSISDSPERRAKYGVPEGVPGVLVTDVLGGSPAANAGIAAGDVIQEVLGTRIDSVSEVLWTVANAAPETVADVLVWRAGEFMRFQPVLGSSCEETAWSLPR